MIMADSMVPVLGYACLWANLEKMSVVPELHRIIA